MMSGKAGVHAWLEHAACTHQPLLACLIVGLNGRGCESQCMAV